MTKRKGEITAAQIERDNPYLVAFPLPVGGFGNGWIDFGRLCRLLGVPELRGRGFYENDQEWLTWAFSDEGTARAFAARLAGEARLLLPQSKKKGRPVDPARLLKTPEWLEMTDRLAKKLAFVDPSIVDKMVESGIRRAFEQRVGKAGEQALRAACAEASAVLRRRIAEIEAEAGDRRPQ